MYQSGIFAVNYAIAAIAEKYPLTITASTKEKVAHFVIDGVISQNNKTIKDFTTKVDSYIKSGIKEAYVKIKSPGGDVFVANEIKNALQKFTDGAKGEGGVIVASAATYIAMHLKEFRMPKNGQWMWHKPSGNFNGNENEIASKLQLLKNITAEYKETYATKSVHSKEEIEKLWTSGDVWLTAQEATDQKFITGLLPDINISAQDNELIAAFGSPKAPKIDKDKLKPKKMEELVLIAQSLGLKKEATLSDVLKAVADLKQSALDNETAFTALKKKLEETEQEESQNLIAQLKEKKLVGDIQAKVYEDLFAKDFSNTKKIVASLLGTVKAPKEETSTDEKLQAYLDDLNIKSKGGSKLNPNDLTFEELSKNHSQLLAQIQKEEPEVFTKLLDEYNQS
ncbi:ATP-dependent Clp protease, protease subunit [Tenacibaculum sp. 190524A02b]|uniref:ATP-dependent Clp protease, protease subunit n=1 Tax=Tenacibaculum vairaonense TaxID=3137860 RepID=A0ABP1FCV1_9FLAO